MVVRLAVAHRLGLYRRDVRAAARLRHREGTADLPGRHPRQVPLLLLLRAVLKDHVRDDEVGVDDAADRHPAARDLLDAQGVGQQGLPQATVLLGDHQPEDPHLLHALDDLRRVLVPVLELVGHRDDLLLDELAHELDELALLLREAFGLLESGHRCTPPSRGGQDLPRVCRVVTGGDRGTACESHHPEKSGGARTGCAVTLGRAARHTAVAMTPRRREMSTTVMGRVRAHTPHTLESSVARFSGEPAVLV